MRATAGYLPRPLNAQLLNNFVEAMAINWKAPHLAALLARVCSNPDVTPPLFRLLSQQTRSIRAEFALRWPWQKPMQRWCKFTARLAGPVHSTACCIARLWLHWWRRHTSTYTIPHSAVAWTTWGIYSAPVHTCLHNDAHVKWDAARLCAAQRQKIRQSHHSRHVTGPLFSSAVYLAIWHNQDDRKTFGRA